MRPREKKITEVWITQKVGKQRGHFYQKMKRYPDERHTQTHGALIEIFRQSQTSFSIKRTLLISFPIFCFTLRMCTHHPHKINNIHNHYITFKLLFSVRQKKLPQNIWGYDVTSSVAPSNSNLTSSGIPSTSTSGSGALSILSVTSEDLLIMLCCVVWTGAICRTGSPASSNAFFLSVVLIWDLKITWTPIYKHATENTDIIDLTNEQPRGFHVDYKYI